VHVDSFSEFSRRVREIESRARDHAGFDRGAKCVRFSADEIERDPRLGRAGISQSNADGAAA
jgi:hypothetical protein